MPLWPHRKAHYVQRVQLVTLVTQLVPACAWSGLVSWPLAAGLTGATWLLVASRLQLLVHDRPRPRWAVRWVDEPVFFYWGACAYALLLFAALAGALAVAERLGETAPAALLGQWPQSVSAAALVAFLVACPVAAWSTWGIRSRVRVRAVEVTLSGLPLQFDGYRIVHLSDLHIGSFAPASRGRRWARQANALEADLCVVTGDFVTSSTAYYGEVAEVVGSLRARDGVFACLGNHDQCDSQQLAERLGTEGVVVLRNQWRCLRRNGACIVVAGLDDRYTEQDDLDAALAGRPAGVTTLLLAHDPVVGEDAARRGIELVLSGHTHGGQFGLPWLGRHVNLSLVTRQPRGGLRERDGCYQHVTAGLGTTGPPLRLGVAPEIALVRLRSAQRRAAG